MEQNLLGCYRAIEDSSAKMLEAARQRDWDAVVQLEGYCAAQIELLRLRGRVEQLDAKSKAEKTRIMLRILNNDAQIRVLAEPWLSHCESNLDEKRLLH